MMKRIKRIIGKNNDLIDLYISEIRKFKNTIAIPETIQDNDELLLKLIIHVVVNNTNMIINAKEFIENDNINCDLLPLCLLSEKKRNKYLSKFRNKYMLTYNNPDVSLIRDESSSEKNVNSVI